MRFLLGLALCLPTSPIWAQRYVVSTIAGGAAAPASASALSLALGQPGRVATDPAGNVYFTALHSVFKLNSDGSVTRIAGNGTPGFSGDGGPATSAQLNNPEGMAITTSGDVYVADTNNQRVRLVSKGIITTVAGNGQPGSAGDFGDPLLAQLHLPVAVALDGSGNLYIADAANHVIREVAFGYINSVVGNHIAGYSHDNESAIVAALNTPTDLVFDSSGNMFIADSGNGRIREVSGGVITTFSGAGVTFTEGGQAGATVLTSPRSVAVDSAGNVYIADYDANRIRKVSKGIITTVAGSGTPGFAGDGGAATSAQINAPSSVAVDAGGNLYFVDLFNGRVRKVTSSGTISTVAGNGVTGYSGDGGQAQNALMNGPLGVAAAAGGVVYVTDTNNQRVRRIAADHSIATIAGNGTAGFAGDNASASGAQVAFPGGAAVDASGNLYFADTANHRVRKIAGGNITTVAGNGTQGYAGDNGAAASAQLNSPAAVAVDAAGNLYIADFSNQVVRRVTAGGTITTLAGTGVAGFGGDGGPAAAAQLNGPAGVAVDASGNVYVSDSGNHRVRRIDPNGVITTFAGDGNVDDTGSSGPAISQHLSSPSGLAVDASGDLFISDPGASRIRMITAGGLMLTIGGTGAAGYSGDTGPASAAQFNGVSGITVDSSGNLYVADRGNNVIRMLQLVGSAPSAGTVTNAASNVAGAVAPGESITIYGSGIGPDQLTVAQPDANGALPRQLAGVTVYIGGQPAPLLYVWANQIGALVPYGISGPTSGLTIQFGDQISLQLPLTVAPYVPGLFTADASGKGAAAANNEDGTANTPATPAPNGGVVVVYATGVGALSPQPADGVAGFGRPLAGVTASVGGQPALVQFAAAEGYIPAGTVRVFIRLNGNVTGNALPVQIQVNGVASQTGVTVSVK